MSTPTVDALLRRSHGGDRDAIDALALRVLPFVRERVHARLGEKLRAKAETGDYVQEALVRVLEYGPRFLVADETRLRALLARIVENVIRDGHDRLVARRRDPAREKPLARDSILALDPPLEAPTRPSVAAARGEEDAWIPLAMGLLEAADREVLYAREWDGRAFADVGAALGVTEDAARMRHGRAIARLAKIVRLLRAGRMDEVLREDGA